MTIVPRIIVFLFSVAEWKASQVEVLGDGQSGTAIDVYGYCIPVLQVDSSF
jgi:hypothetical protein